MIYFYCPHCRTKLQAKEESAGKRIQCPHCRHVEEVPLLSREAIADPPRKGTHNQAKAQVPEDTTLPLPSRPPSADAATLQPASAPSVQTVACEAHAEPADRATREIVKGEIAYELEGEIARGGMGAILRAVDQDIRREVAIKVLLNQADDRQKVRFIEEAQITGQLEH